MAPRIKLKKTKKKKNKEEPSGRNRWPDLPEQLLHQIEKQRLLREEVLCCRSLTKSWRVDKCKSNSTQLPWLQLALDHEVSDTKNKPDNPYCRGLLALTPYCWFPYIIRDLIDGGVCYLSYSPFKYVILTGNSMPALAFSQNLCYSKTKDWTFMDSNIVDPHGRGKFLQFKNGIWFQEKFYALSLQGTLAVVERDNVDSDVLRITDLSKKRAVPSDWSSTRCFREYLIESEGTILLVFLVSRSSVHKVDSVEVYHVETDKLTWSNRDSLGDVTLFLGANCYSSVTASRVGCRRNCICFTHGSSTDGWWVYDMETTTITPEWISGSKSSIWMEEALLE